MRKNNKKNGSQQLEVAVGAISPKKPHARRNPPTPKIWRAKLFPPKPWARPDPATQKKFGQKLQFCPKTYGTCRGTPRVKW